MSKRAFLFPGQGSQTVGMGKDIYEADAEVRRLYHQANDILGFDLAEICFEGSEDALRQTRITQPALYVHSCALFMLLQGKNINADAVAGHSLGEFSALTAADAWSFAQGLQLVKLRGELMQKAGQNQPGAMAAILGLDFDKIRLICEQASQEALVVPANYNSPGQVVISGTSAGVKKALQLANENGAKRVIELNVSGAFHSPLMASAKAQLSQALQAVEIKAPAIPVYVNVTASVCQDPSAIRQLLGEQLVSPVLWAKSIENMIQDGICEFVEVGRGTVLGGLVRKINRQVQVRHISGLAQLLLL